MRPDDEALCWLCDSPLTDERTATSWHGFGAHRECAREEAGRAEAEPPSDRVIRTST